MRQLKWRVPDRRASVNGLGLFNYPGRVFTLPGLGIPPSCAHPVRVLWIPAGLAEIALRLKCNPLWPAFPARCRFPGAMVFAAIRRIGRLGWEEGLDVGGAHRHGVIAGMARG